MIKPKVFIGSSSEGLRIAEAVFNAIAREVDATLWTNQLFAPGSYPLEVLDDALRNHSFAILVASPDDEMVKRGIAASAMRDNVLLEFGLFLGAFGRRRVFFVCPDQPKIELPSDLAGLSIATYDAHRVGASISDRSAAVQVPCSQIRAAISKQWDEAEALAVKRRDDARASKEYQSIHRLNEVATRLRDTLMVLQRDSLAALTDRIAFEDVKKAAATEADRLTGMFEDDARSVGAGDELRSLCAATQEAILELPFPEELAPGREAVKEKFINAGVGAFNAFMGGGDPIRHVQGIASSEAEGRLATLAKRYQDWWEKHSLELHRATARLQDSLFDAMAAVSVGRLNVIPID